ncbi:MAG: CHAT domain-containing protein [Gemmataceae bacterium]|nr:CHAT domain-containing protein [Gemmataceae bacterium]
MAQPPRHRTEPTERTGREPPAPALTEQQKAKVKTRDQLVLQALALAKQNKWLEASALVEQSVAVLREALDDLHPEVLRTWEVLGQMHVFRKDYPAARKVLEEIVRLQRRRLGPGHWQTRDAELQLAHVVFLGNAAPATRAQLDRAFQWMNLAAAESSRSQFGKAEELLRQALVTCREVLGEENRHTAANVAMLASALTELNKHAEAEKLHRQALAIFGRILGDEHPTTVVSLANLASDLSRQGKNAEAERLQRQALVSQRRLLGEHDPKTAELLNGLAVSLRNQGQYAEAEHLFRQSLGIHSKLPAQDHDTAIGLNNLAQVLMDQGKHAEAEQLNRAALAVFRKLRWDTHPHTATVLGNLGVNLSSQGKFTEAEKLYREALAISRAVLGEEHLQTADSMNNVARILIQLGQFPEADQLFGQALAIYRKIGGDDNLSLADTLRLAAAIRFYQDRYGEAAQSLGQALTIFRRVLGDEHPETGMSLSVLGLILHADGDFAGAEQAAQAAAKVFLSVRPHVSFGGLDRAGFSQPSPLAFLAALRARRGQTLDAWAAYEQYLGRGLFDDLAARTSRPLTEAERAREESLLGQLASVEKRLPGLRAAKNPKEADQLRSQRDQLLLELTAFQSALVKRYGMVAGEVYDLIRIQKQLPPDAALVAWLDFESPAQAKDPGGEHWGVVVRRQGAPIWTKLAGSGPEETWTARDYKVLRTVRQLLHAPNIDSAIDWQAALADLAKQRLRPLTPHLDGVKRLIVLPSVAMVGVPTETLTDDYTISYAPSGSLHAWLLENRGRVGRGSDSLLALADPVFPQQAVKGQPAKEQPAKEQPFKAALGAKDFLPALLRGAAPRPLPGTRREVEAIAALFTSKGGHVEKLFGPDANGGNLDRLANKRELAQFRHVHLATHGYPDSKGGMNSYLALTPADPVVTSHDKLTAGHMLRTWKLNADLVTLSACETALGQHQGGEGYVGFAQALLLAGARSLVLSQWPADDRATTLLMRRFYQNLLGARPELPRPMAKAEALAEAKRWLRSLSRHDVIGQLQALDLPFQERQLDGERPFEHPFFWAPFILIGDPG